MIEGLIVFSLRHPSFLARNRHPAGDKALWPVSRKATLFFDLANVFPMAGFAFAVRGEK